MSLIIQSATKRPGVNHGKLARIRRDVETCRAKVRGLSDHRADVTRQRQEGRGLLRGNLPARYALDHTYAGLDWFGAIESQLADVRLSDLKAAGIDPELVADVVAWSEGLDAVTRQLAEAQADLSQRMTLLARLEEYANHA